MARYRITIGALDALLDKAKRERSILHQSKETAAAGHMDAAVAAITAARDGLVVKQHDLDRAQVGE